jgi:hypothetical protein
MLCRQIYEACAHAYPGADVREILDMINHIASRHKLMLKTNAALERLVYPDKLPELTRKISAVRRGHIALQIESGFKYMRM